MRYSISSCKSKGGKALSVYCVPDFVISEKLISGTLKK